MVIVAINVKTEHLSSMQAGYKHFYSLSQQTLRQWLYVRTQKYIKQLAL